MLEEERNLEILGIGKEYADILYKRITGDHMSFYRNGSNILDCGSGVGGFSLQTALRTGAKTVYAYEGYSESFNLLLKNRNGNSAGNLMPDDHHILGSTGRQLMGVSSGITNALGAGESHLVETRAIDDLMLPFLDCVRITVPGGALQIISGGMERIKREEPAIVVETSSKKERGKVMEILGSIGYTSEGEEYFREVGSLGTRLIFLRKN